MFLRHITKPPFNNRYVVLVLAALILASNILCIFYFFPHYKLLSYTTIVIILLSFMVLKSFTSIYQELIELFEKKELYKDEDEVYDADGLKYMLNIFLACIWVFDITIIFIVHYLNI